MGLEQTVVENHFQGIKLRFFAFGLGFFLFGALTGFFLGRKTPAEALSVVEGQLDLSVSGRELSFDPKRGSKLVKANAMGDSPSGIVDLIDYNRVELPEKALKYFQSAGVFAFGPKLGTDLIETLDLEPDDVVHIERAASNALKQIAAFEAEHAELRVDASGGDYYFVPSLGDAGQRIREEFRSTVGTSVSRGVASLLIQGMKHSQTFADFGERARHLSIVEQKIEGGDSVYFFEQRFVRDDGTASGGGANRIFESGLDNFKVRYGRLFKELRDSE